ncbi:MAG: maltose alpha-D-glucosyltransferase [Candidatus Riflebacteria bacterium HGW-Riflebacteria-1]|jgi:maltose alpha-D-glucosyltransferase/alpha-amylase|nr:MAG: maltose alpha-D-glucosyltransferase [Candidatus Riflebacteria bacterium HGW-Riflebacteria-1]
MKKGKTGVVIAEDPMWHKNAIIYEVHVKAFYDSDGDGIGDFQGLTQKLDYIHSLGVNTIWLLPFYPSPFRDDGYDISNYLDVHPSYGTLADFKHFLHEAHSRNLRVIIELVINHTSDTHPWFQESRRAAKGSSARNYYVWNDDDNKFSDARIIFTDTETSNWSWDPVAKAYYWHRFFSHQPDLNFHNPQVVKKLIAAMRFWLDMGVDGLRLDAIPYLCEREGTSCENLPETHSIIKLFRKEMDKRYKNRIFLAEANQWPEDAAEYFGDGDECHMAYHFPLMPRMYMALALEDRFPVVEIMKQTPEIPANCQWAIFLRNHDELTLEMVTSKERDYMYESYANDPRARINVGIRRRLSPLMEYNRAKIELMNALLLSMPGSPVLYYGDEIGMGDNLFLGDRNGVRTPMQWTPDRNGGFSSSDPERLFLPPVMGAITGFQALNVEAQSKNPSSLLNWMKRIIAVRSHCTALGEGSIEFIKPANRKILAYVRTHGDANILCIANLSRSAQPVQLDLAKFKGYTPVEMLGKHAFPTISDEPYQLSLTGYGFYWFELSLTTAGPAWQKPDLSTMPELSVMVFRSSGEKTFLPDLNRLLGDKKREKTLQESIQQYCTRKRWFAGKGRELLHIETELAEPVTLPGCQNLLVHIFSAHFADNTKQCYFFPYQLTWESASADGKILPGWVFGKTRQQNEVGYLVDAMGSDEFCHAVLRCMRANEEISLSSSVLYFSGSGLLDSLISEDFAVRRPIIEQSHTSVFFGEKYIFKIYRNIQSGPSPELQMGKHLTAADFKNIARVAGTVEIEKDGNSTVLGILQEYIDNQNDCWSFTLNYLDCFLDTCLVESSGMPANENREVEGGHELYLVNMQTLGQRLGKMHSILAESSEDPNFNPEPIPEEEIQTWAAALETTLVNTVAQLGRITGNLSPEIRPLLEKMIAHPEQLVKKMRAMIPAGLNLLKTRHHGDLHLGQVLLVANDFVFIDFEGEPARPLSERIARHCPLRDVAGIVRSLSYAAETARRKVRQERPDALAVMTVYTREWEKLSRERFLKGYLEATVGCPSVPVDREHFDSILSLLCLEKALYEFSYELNNRPDWLEIPVFGLIECLGQR